MTTPDLNAFIAVIPLELRELPHFVVWRLQKRREGPTKVPYSPTTKRGADSTDPATWATLNDALKAFLSGPYNGIGFMFGSGFSGTDLDHCRDKKTGKIEPWALAVVEKLNSYTEISPSGDGLHIFTKGKLPGKGLNCRVDGHKIEMYDSGRFFTLTGDHLNTTPKTINDRQDETSELYEWVLQNCDSAKRATKKKADASRQTLSPVCLEDQELLRRAGNAANGPKFLKLHSGDSSDYLKDNGEPDLSDADQAYVNILCFWSQDDQQVARSWRSSGRWREKLDRDDYVFGTIKTARESQTEMYTGGGLGLHLATPVVEEQEISDLVEIEDDDPPISDDPRREAYLRQLARNTAKVLEVCLIILRLLGFQGSYTRILSALFAIGGDRLNFFFASQKRIRDYYAESKEASSEDTVKRDLKKILEEQDARGVALLRYIPGWKNLQTGKGSASKFQNLLLRYVLQSINISLDHPDIDPETGKKLTRRQKLEIACQQIVASVPRVDPKETVRAKKEKSKTVEDWEMELNKVQDGLIHQMRAEGWTAEEAEEEFQRLHGQAFARLRQSFISLKTGPESAASKGCNHAPFTKYEIEPDLEVIIIQ